MIERKILFAGLFVITIALLNSGFNIILEHFKIPEWIGLVLVTPIIEEVCRLCYSKINKAPILNTYFQMVLENKGNLMEPFGFTFPILFINGAIVSITKEAWWALLLTIPIHAIYNGMVYVGQINFGYQTITQPISWLTFLLGIGFILIRDFKSQQ